MRINPIKLEAKYALDVYQELPGFPSDRDRTYILMRSLEESGFLDKEFVAENIWNSMKSCFGTLKEFRSFLNSLSEDNENLQSEQLLKRNPSPEWKYCYRLIRNPWM
jgi:hypothetical protein